MKIHNEVEEDIRSPDSRVSDLSLHEFFPNLQRYQDFRKRGRSFALIFLYNILFTFVFIPYYIIQHKFPLDYSQMNYPTILYTVQLFFLALALLCSWIVLFLFYTLNETRVQFRHRIKSTFVLSLTLFFSLHYLTDIFQFARIGSFKSPDYSENISKFPTSSLILLIMVPFNAAEIFRETNDQILFLQWLIMCITLIIAAIANPSPTSIIVMLVFCIMTLFVLVDRYFFSWAVFEDNRDLEEKINQYTRTALERKAVEMRDMIGNVAHDLKTPLSSFMTATEMIRNEIELYQQALQRTSSKDLSDPSSAPMSSSGRKLVSEVFENILTSINSVRDIHLFMLMMINRCIDFKKASNGIELVPVKETIDLPSVIDMPVQCMKNIQHKIKVKVHDFPPELHLYIKTDRQWLQENLLCVLSNAVKHSTGGTVELIVSLQEASNFKKNASKVVEEVVAKNNVMGFATHRRDSTTHSRNQSSSRSSASSPLNSNERKKPVKNSQSEESTFRRLTNMMVPSSGFTPPREKSDSREEETTGHSRLPDIEQGRSNNVELFRTITESSEISEGEDRLLLFEIKDCGVGLSQYELTTFFNPFKQKRLSGGTGLGLYSLAKRVEALGGQFGVHSREDGHSGSVVWFAFPYIPDKSHMLIRQRSSTPWQKVENSEKTIFLQTSHNSSSSNLTSASPALFVKRNTPPALKFLKGAHSDRKLRVLVVEDAPTIAKMTCMMLRKQNIETEIAENGQIALDMIIRSFDESKFDAVLMDFQMPVMDGIEATKRIRELEEDRRKHKLSGTEVHSFEDEKDDDDAKNTLPIIGISAMSDSEVIEEGLKAGMNVFIPKPFSSKDFKAFIEKIQKQRL